ncbi:MAG: 5-methyltetrahydropteroyltriglutamate--homocysteine S-methyltransferase [bacterium]
MARSTNLGFPRFGIRREWKKASEGFWSGKLGSRELHATADELMQRHWQLQIDAGIDVIPVGDFAWYDHVLDTIALVGAVPKRYRHDSSSMVDMDTYFAMARGRQDGEVDVTAMEMTKWFDTNYHYIVPEFEKGMQFHLASERPFETIEKARNAGVHAPRPVLVGPVSFLLLGKVTEQGIEVEDFVKSLAEVYSEVLGRFADLGIDWVQMDEPVLALDLDDKGKAIFEAVFAILKNLEKRPKILINTYFGPIEHNLSLALGLGEGLHVDLVRAPDQLEAVLDLIGEDQVLSVGVVDGRNVWRTDLDKALVLVRKAVAALGSERVEISPSCSLLHSPIDLTEETKLDPRIREWLAFGVQKLNEIVALAHAVNDGEETVSDFFASSRESIQRRRTSPLVTNADVQKRLHSIGEKMTHRQSPYEVRIEAQRNKLHLPTFPTTTIGSFPQTREVRQLRARLKKGELSQQQYEKELEKEILETLKLQEDMDVDVLVHGEYERNDMVEYFGEQLEGYVFTQNGWVQSYGSRGVKPPIIFGDIFRKGPMTVRWSKFAKEHTKRPLKGMLTGPVTMLQWSFVRDDQPRPVTCEQIALAIRDEVVDLEKAGIDMIQIDEPAIREGLPLRRVEWPIYLDWAVRCFRLTSSGVSDETQIHTHMCYSEFNNMMDSIAAMDADVISIEASRSKMELLDSFEDFVYPNDIGPGVWDIHSPRVPSKEEMVNLLRVAMKHVPRERLWVNPDCGLKTRRWEETKASLQNMVAAAKELRKELVD